MSVDQDRIINQLIAELPGLVFTTRDPVVNYLAPDTMEKVVRLRTMLRDGQSAAARELVERELVPRLEKLEEVMTELVERKVPPFEGLPAVGRVMALSREFREAYRSESQRPATQR